LQKQPTSPSFYYRAETRVVFIAPEAVEKLLPSYLASRESAKRLATLVHADLPLEIDQDLFRYNFTNWYYRDTIERVVMAVLESGHGSIVGEGGVWEKRITVVHDHGVGSCRSEIFAGERGVNRILSTLDCSD